MTAFLMANKMRSMVLVLSLGSSLALADMVDDPDQLPSTLPGVPVTPGKTTPDADKQPEGGEKKPPSTRKGDVKPALTDPASGASGSKKSSASKKKNSGKSPISLKSDGKSTYSKNGRVIQLNQNVVISQDQLRLQADEAKVLLAEEGADHNVDRVEINGNVRVSNFSELPEDKVSARGDRAYFINSKRTITLVGNARLWKGGHLIKGKQITYDVDSGVITVDRAEGVVKPEEVQGKGKVD